MHTHGIRGKTSWAAVVADGGRRVLAAVGRPRSAPSQRNRTVLNDIVSHVDWLPTFLAAAGEPDIADKLKAGHELNGTTYKVHLDGSDLLPYLTGDVDEIPRNSFFYVSDDGDLMALRYDNWKFVFLEQRAPGTAQVWVEPFNELRIPKVFNLKTDPFERADIMSNTYFDWMISHAYLMNATLIPHPTRSPWITLAA
jgi:arylsulfatase A-like enzyme